MKKLICLFMLLCLAAFPAAGEEAFSPALAADGAHALALDASGRVWVWGSNHMGESSPSCEENRILTPTVVFENAVAVSAGQQFSMALSKDGELYAWGDVHGAGECIRLRSDVIQMDACDSLASYVTKDGKLYAWENGEETLLSENAVKCAAGLNFVLELDKNGNVYEHISGEKTLKLENASDIDASGESRYAVTKDNSLFAWGANASDGRLGLSGTGETVTEPVRIDIPNISSVRAGLSVSGCITNENTLCVWGSVYSYLTHVDENGEVLASLNDGALLTYGSTPLPLYENVADAAFGDAFVMILFENGDVFTWGANDHGQHGNGTFTETALYEDEEDGEYELSVVSASQGIFPSVPINLKTAR